MGVLAFVIGVASTFLVEFIPISVMQSSSITDTISFLPIFSIIAFIPSIVGLVLGIADIIDKNKKGEAKSLPALGIILSGCSLAVILLFTFTILLEYNNEAKLEAMVERRMEEYWDELNGTTYLFDEDELEDDEEYYYDEDFEELDDENGENDEDDEDDEKEPEDTNIIIEEQETN